MEKTEAEAVKSQLENKEDLAKNGDNDEVRSPYYKMTGVYYAKNI